MGNAAMAMIIKLSMVLTVAGWVCVWILMPTKLWLKSWHKAEDQAERSIFGSYSLFFAVLCLPILLAAIIAYIYLHLWAGRQRTRLSRLSPVMKSSNPLFVHNFVGIISSAELLLAVLFTIFLAWTLYTRVSNDFQKIVPVKSLKLDKWQFKVVRIGTRCGSLAEACLVLLLLPILRGMSMFRVVGIQFENSVRYHIWLGNMMIALATLHGFLTLFVWGVKGKLADEIPRWQKTGRVNIAGLLTLATGLIIWTTSLPQIRRKKFEVFYFTHHLYIVFLVFFLFHAGDRHFYSIFSGVLLYAIDKLLRIIQSRQTTALISACVLPCRKVELTFLKPPGLKYTPTSIVFIKIPRISNLQWHPFSLTSCADDGSNLMSILVKVEGEWTNQLYKLIEDSDNGDLGSISVAVEGPYGPPDLFYERYDCLLLIAGGIGITPFLSILQDMQRRYGDKNITQISKRVNLVYVVKKFEDLSMLNSIHQLMENKFNGQSFLRLHVYVTQEEGYGASLEELLQGLPQSRRVFFDKNDSEYTMARPASTLSMAGITALSSVAYLISIIALSHAFLGSKEGKTSKKSPSWIADFLVISSFKIAMVCSIFAGILLRWTKSSTEISTLNQKLEKLTEMQTLVDRQSIGEQHEIHFHRRPYFEDILPKFQLESERSNIGVLVCGPSSMQESVASACRLHNCSGRRDNKRCGDFFSYHSLNFAL